MESLDANCLLNISRQYIYLFPEGCLDRRNVTLVRLVQVSHQLRIPISPLLAEEFRQHRRAKKEQPDSDTAGKAPGGTGLVGPPAQARASDCTCLSA